MSEEAPVGEFDHLRSMLAEHMTYPEMARRHLRRRHTVRAIAFGLFALEAMILLAVWLL